MLEPGPLPSSTNAGLIRTLLLTFILPVCSILIEFTVKKIPVDPALIGKWFIFWGFGVRLFIAGILQLFRPGLTAVRIYNLRNAKSFAIIKELGVVNISLGAMGIFSLFNSEGRPIAAISGCIFFGLATIGHFFRKPDTGNGIMSLVTDLLLFSVILLYLFFTLFFNQ